MSVGTNATRSHQEFDTRLTALEEAPAGGGLVASGETAYFTNGSAANYATAANLVPAQLDTLLKVYEGPGVPVDPATFADFSGWIAAPNTPATGLCSLVSGLYLFRYFLMFNGTPTDVALNFLNNFNNANYSENLSAGSSTVKGAKVLPFYDAVGEFGSDLEVDVTFATATELDWIEFYITPLVLAA